MSAATGSRILAALRFPEPDGLLPAIVQDAATGAVRMLGHMNRDALAATLESRRVTFWSRSRARLWTKGETSGAVLELVDLAADCDGDAILVRARPAGPTCHGGGDSCFGELALGATALGRLEATIRARLAAGDAESSYSARLAAAGPARIAQKVGEEAVEAALAGASGSREALISESADLLYHLVLLLAARGVELAEPLGELDRRARRSAAG